MSISSIPSSFLSGVRDKISSDLLQTLWERRSTAEQTQLTKQDSIGAPAANFLANPGITSLTRDAAWAALTDAQRATYLSDSASSSTSTIISSSETAASYRKSGFATRASSTATAGSGPLDFGSARLGAGSQTPTTETSTAYRAIWKEDFATSGLLKAAGAAGNANGGAVFVSIRAGTGTERATNPYTDDTTRTDDDHDRFEAQLTAQAKQITDRFGATQAVLGYDANGNGYLDDESELFGFDGATPGPSLSSSGIASDRLMVLTASGQSIKVSQSSIATSAAATGYLSYTNARSVLRGDASGGLEVVVDTSVGMSAPAAAAPRIGWIGVPDGPFGAGRTVDVTVAFDQDVTVAPATGSRSTLDLMVGSTRRSAAFLSSSGSTITYRYTIAAGEADVDGITVPAGALTLNGTTIKGADGRDADIASTARTAPRATVDTVGPRVLSAAITSAPKTYVAGDVIEIGLTMDEDPVVTGKPSIALQLRNPGTGPYRNVVADFAAVDGKRMLFRYVVQPGDTDTDGIQVVTNSLSLPVGASIKDGGGNAISSVGFTTVSSTVHKIDTTRPAPTSIAVNSTATSYRTGDIVEFKVVVNDDLLVNNSSSTLAIQIGSQQRTAAFASSTRVGTTTELIYRYTVGATDSGGGGGLTIPANALNPGGALLSDRAGNPLDPTSTAVRRATFLFNGT